MQLSPVLAIHICGGTLGLLSGAAAMSFRKGSRLHATAGQIFVFSMCGLGASAMHLAVRKGQIANFFGGILTIYLVTTAWLTARPSKGESSHWYWAAILVPLGVGVSSLSNGVQRLIDPAAFHDGVPAAMNFFMATVVLLAALGDVRMLLRGLSPTQRLARHLWRMCFALFIASGSIFIARPHLFPRFLRDTGALVLLGVLPLLLLIFWSLRVRFKPFYGGKLPTGQESGYSPLGQAPLAASGERTAFQSASFRG